MVNNEDIKKKIAIQKIIGNNIRKLRLEKSMTQKDLNKKLKLSHNGISSIENGKHPISVSKIIEICLALETNMYQLLYGISKIRSDNKIREFCFLKNEDKKIVLHLIHYFYDATKNEKIEEYKKASEASENVENIKKIVGRNIKILRENKSLSQSKIAKIFKISVNTVNSMESGKNFISLFKIIELCNFFKTDICYLFNDTIIEGAIESNIEDFAKSLGEDPTKSSTFLKFINEKMRFLNQRNKDIVLNLIHYLYINQHPENKEYIKSINDKVLKKQNSYDLDKYFSNSHKKYDIQNY